MTVEKTSIKPEPPPGPDPKSMAQAKLVSRIMQTVATATSLTAIEALGALEMAKTQIALAAVMSHPANQPGQQSNIIKPGGMN